MRLKTLPVDVNAKAIASGLLAMFDESERAVLRFGMLPAAKMECLEKQLGAHFRALGTDCGDGDKFFAILKAPNERCREFSMKALVSEALRAVTLELYAIGELVV